LGGGIDINGAGAESKRPADVTGPDAVNGFRLFARACRQTPARSS